MKKLADSLWIFIQKIITEGFFQKQKQRKQIAGVFILVMKAERENGVCCVKGALENKQTGEIALMTSTNSEEYITSRGHRAIKSHDPEWFVGHHRMAAPMVFWRELANRVRY